MSCSTGIETCPPGGTSPSITTVDPPGITTNRRLVRLNSRSVMTAENSWAPCTVAVKPSASSMVNEAYRRFLISATIRPSTMRAQPLKASPMSVIHAPYPSVSGPASQGSSDVSTKPNTDCIACVTSSPIPQTNTPQIEKCSICVANRPRAGSYSARTGCHIRPSHVAAT